MRVIYDYAIIGCGIVGLSTAYNILQIHPNCKIIIIDKEDSVARHQTGHNSGVIHAGIYYKPGSLKAQLCREGCRQIKEFCNSYRIPFEECGKLIVATSIDEMEHLESLYVRSNENNLEVEMLSKKSLETLEPNITGIAAIKSYKTGIVDYKAVSLALFEVLVHKNVDFKFDFNVLAIEQNKFVEIMNGTEKIFASKVVFCAGLQADRLLRMSGFDLRFRIVPFKGEYYRLSTRLNSIVKHLIYPVPDPSLPFLGVHLTRMIDGSITVGPNAVIAFDREGYSKYSLDLRDTLDFITFPGFWKLINKYKTSAASELATYFSKASYLKKCQKYCPSLEIDDLLPYSPGIRAQAVSIEGDLIHDFLFANNDKILHVCNAPSPAATSSLPIGKMIAEKITSI